MRGIWPAWTQRTLAALRPARFPSRAGAARHQVITCGPTRRGTAMSAPAESGPAASDELDPGLAELIDRLTARLQAGEHIDLEACVREHPQYASQLRELVP